MSWLYLWFNPCAFLSTPVAHGTAGAVGARLPRALPLKGGTPKGQNPGRARRGRIWRVFWYTSDCQVNRNGLDTARPAKQGLSATPFQGLAGFPLIAQRAGTGGAAGGLGQGQSAPFER